MTNPATPPSVGYKYVWYIIRTDKDKMNYLRSFISTTRTITWVEDFSRALIFADEDSAERYIRERLKGRRNVRTKKDMITK